ncbi:CaiB/BaiF CoA-transferase family protein [Acidovorax sp. sic0104]|uniref:CaiB/BaiF CoA transferase family protein n=1 Tax=Acidovorax sp. sic0104 TaxID=2854784 RepID=UPI001C48EDF2|nr:CoA transferase [Acidovorax sp. sic0104]MBV7541982.1 CoA transferase [Acidovorax sp. sic0104]
MHQNLPLQGIRVVDLSRILSGPYCAMLLADLGAQVLKVESPQSPDQARTWGPPFHREQVAPHFLAANRGKSLLHLDLQDAGDIEHVRALIAQADVVVENFKVGSLKKLGLCKSELMGDHKRLIWCSITGFGGSGPFAQRPGYDAIAQAASGWMSLTGNADCGPMKAAPPILDQSTGLFAALGIVAKLHQRQATGVGGLVEANLFASGFALLGPFAQSTLLTGRSQTLVGNANPFISPFGRFLCDQGSYLMLTIGSDQQFTTLCRLLGVDESVAQDFAEHHVRLDRAHELNGVLQGAFSRLAAQEWEGILGARGIACSSVNSVAQALAHPQVEPLGLVQKDRLGQHQIASPIFLEGAPLCAHSPAPLSDEAMSPVEARRWFAKQPTPSAVHS